jgi:hypothetical protein
MTIFEELVCEWKVTFIYFPTIQQQTRAAKILRGVGNSW